MRILAMVFVMIGQAFAQDPVRDPNPVLEEVMEEMEQESDEQGEADAILELLDDPVDLNTAGWAELQRVPGLTPLVAYRITTYRQKEPFQTVVDLLNVEGVTEDAYARIAPFVTVRPAGIRTTATIRSRVRMDTEERRGIREGTYTGGRAGTRHRVLVKSEPAQDLRLEAFVLSAKDAGEPVSASFLSGYALVGSGRWRAIAGDLRVATGLQMHLGSRVPSSLSGPLSVRSPGIAVQGYRSASEGAILRGAALGIDVTEELSFAVFYSNRPVHGTVSPEGVLSPSSAEGAFRTESERSRRNASRERVVGAMVAWGERTGLGVSLSGFHGRFVHPARLGAVNPDTTREFAGAAMSGWLNAEMSSIAVEGAVERGGAASAGVIIQIEPSPLWRVSLAGRAFAAGYTRPMAGIRNPVPESELSASAGVRVTNAWRLTGFADGTMFSRGREPTEFGEMTGRSGFESLVTIAPRTQVALAWTTRQTMENRQIATPEGLLQTIRGPAFRRHWRLGIVSGKGNEFQWSLRVEHVVFTGNEGGRERGTMLSQQCRWMATDRLLIEAKVSLYGTESFRSRLFTFEPDVPGSFAARMVYGRGSRIAGLIRAKPWDGTEFSVSYATEVRDDVEQLGSGWDEIAGDHHGVVSIQIDVQL